MDAPRRNERGAVTVEFAVVLPLVLVLLGTVIFAGWLGLVRAILEHGASEGVRFASVPATSDLRSYPDNGAVSAHVDQSTPMITPTDVQVLSSLSGAARNAPVTVRVTYGVPNPVAGLLAPLEAFGWAEDIPETITVTATALGRRE
jgi:Flp pilus assembly protein TadG